MDEYLPASDSTPPDPSLSLQTRSPALSTLNSLSKAALRRASCVVFVPSATGISTAVTTCLLTGLSTIGSSRQKQMRFAGGHCGWLSYRDGFAGVHSACLPRSVAGFTVLLPYSLRLRLPGTGIEPSVVLRWIAGRSGFLPYQSAGIRCTDVALHSKGPRRWRVVGPAHDVAGL